MIVKNSDDITRYDVDYKDLNNDGISLYNISSDDNAPKINFTKRYFPLNSSKQGIEHFIEAQEKFDLYILKIDLKIRLDDRLKDFRS